MPEPVTWIGSRDECNICHSSTQSTPFVDGRTIYGPWALMCLSCHSNVGVGLGTGRGQKYNAEGVKIEG